MTTRAKSASCASCAVLKTQLEQAEAALTALRAEQQQERNLHIEQLFNMDVKLTRAETELAEVRARLALPPQDQEPSRDWLLKRNEWLSEHLLRTQIELGRLAFPAWQPIETAPKDDRIIVVYAVQSGLRVTTARWAHAVINGRWDSAWKCDVGVIEPTHWMPLPAPPSGDTLPAFITHEGHDGTASAPDESDPH